ncbi:MAG: polysaccharide biosynthesis/export family protein [Bacteroidales bacterium]
MIKRCHTMRTSLKIIIILAVIALFTVGCIPQKRILLMQYDQINDSSYANTFVSEDSVLHDYRIQSNDYLYISVSTIEKELSLFMEPMGGINFLNETNQALIGYYVDDEGYVNFPYLGRISVGGRTVKDAQQQVKESARKILGDRIRVEVKLINNYVNVLGEVKKEGIYNMTKNRITIYEALTLAGGLTDFARRQEVKVFRTVDGKQKVYLVDVTSGNLIGQNMFYVFPNDVIYVEPMRAKSIGITPTFSLTLFTTLLTTTLTILLLVQQFGALN